MRFKILKFILAVLFLGLGLVSVAKPVLAVDPAVLRDKYKVSFPISQLGGCDDYSACRTYCSDPSHAEACISFAKSKGFYTEPTVKEAELVAIARRDLGCDSAASCENFCQVASNFDKCNRFAVGNSLPGGYVQDVGKKDILDKAKVELGCSSPDTCKEFCSKPENSSKCQDFGRKVGLHGGETRVGPGGCTSEETCRAFCAQPDNYKICSGFSQSAGQKFAGPGGCDSESSCRAYCAKNEAECKRVIGVGPQESCNRTPNCSWAGNTCQCGTRPSSDPAVECKRYGCTWTGNACACANITPVSLEDPATSCQRGQGCTWNGTSCQCPTGNYTPETPASACNRAPGCSWVGTGCRCGNTTYSPGVAGTTVGGYGDRTAQEATCRAGGGSCDWGQGSCNCQGYRSPTSGSCSVPSGGCGTSATWSTTGCYCRPNGLQDGSDGGTPSRESQEAACRSGGGVCVSWVNGACGCERNQGSCTPPYGGCPNGWTWIASACSCNLNSGTTPTPGTCNPPSSGCPSGWNWVASACSCNYSGGTSPSGTPNEGGCQNYTPGMCGSGWFEWGSCSCKSSSTGPGQCGSGLYWNGSSCVSSSTAPSPSPSTSMSPEEACRQGTNCSWNGSSCQCTATQTSPTPTPSPTPAMDPATACGQTSGCSWNGSTCQCGTAQGVSTERGILQIISDFFSTLFPR